MSRLMSVAFTEQAVVERRKTVTRRKGWWEDKNGRRLVKPGDRLTLCRKVMGRKPGEPLVRVAEVEVIDVRREPLCAVGGPYVIAEDGSTVWTEVIAEGFPDMEPMEFMRRFFIDAQGIGVMDDVTRIEWRYMDEDSCPDCGERCDICGDRMCATYGPAPAITCDAHRHCVDCEIDNPCRDCAAERRAA